ncbi:MAG: copper transport protein [Gaiellaceae bacterium]|jgi:copper transport protein|nr:copper transport protein [Gaiellaceae bacterium]
MNDHPSRRACRPVLVAVAAVLVALAMVPAAGAHSRLMTTQPANDAVLEQSPRSVLLRFDEGVETAFGAIRVYDARAHRVDSGKIQRPSGAEVRIRLDRRLARGTYTATWRVVSADGHPVSGAFVFHVGAPSADPAGVAAQVLEGGTPTSVSVLFSIVRAVDFLLLLLVGGGTLMLIVGLGHASPETRSRLARLLSAASILLAVVACAGIVLQGAAAGGFGLGEAVHWDVVSTVLGTRFGTVWLVQAGLAVTCALLLAASGHLPLPSLVPAALLLLTPSLSGHASVSGGIALVADVAHVAAAAVWVGGLAALVLALLWAGAERWELAVHAVPRFSLLAVGAVSVLLVSGTTSGYLEVRALRGLWETTYGQLLLVKIALVLPLLALGLYNNRRAVPRLRERLATAAERTRFLRTAGGELALMVAIVSVTAVLVSEPPARAEVSPRGPYATTAQLGQLELNLVVDPATAGLNQIHLYLTNASGQPTNVDEASVSATLASRQIGPLRLTAHLAGPGHFIVHGAQLALAGDWQLRVETRRGEFGAAAATVSVPIRKEPH